MACPHWLLLLSIRRRNPESDLTHYSMLVALAAIYFVFLVTVVSRLTATGRKRRAAVCRQMKALMYRQRT